MVRAGERSPGRRPPPWLRLSRWLLRVSCRNADSSNRKRFLLKRILLRKTGGYMPDKKIILRQVLDGLMRRYRERVPDVAAILDMIVREGLVRNAAEIENDHIAFRSLGVPH